MLKKHFEKTIPADILYKPPTKNEKPLNQDLPLKTLIALFTAFALLAAPALQAAPQVDVAATTAKFDLLVKQSQDLYLSRPIAVLSEAYTEAVRTGDIEALNEINQYVNNYELVKESDLIASGMSPPEAYTFAYTRNMTIDSLQRFNAGLYRDAIAELKASVASGAMTTATWGAVAVALGVTFGVLTKSDTKVPTQPTTTTTGTN